MKRYSLLTIPATLALGLFTAVVAVGGDGTKVWTVTNIVVVPELPFENPDPKAALIYKATLTGKWQAAAPPLVDGRPRQPAVPGGRSLSPALLSYCVFPSIQVTGKKDAKEPRPWTLPFELALVNAAGAPASPGFQPVQAPVPIPANSTLELRPDPKWCASLPGTSTPPEIYLQVGGVRKQVIFAPLPPAPAPSPAPASPAVRSSSPR